MLQFNNSISVTVRVIGVLGHLRFSGSAVRGCCGAAINFVVPKLGGTVINYVVLQLSLW